MSFSEKNKKRIHQLIRKPHGLGYQRIDPISKKFLSDIRSKATDRKIRIAAIFRASGQSWNLIGKTLGYSSGASARVTILMHYRQKYLTYLKEESERLDRDLPILAKSTLESMMTAQRDDTLKHTDTEGVISYEKKTITNKEESRIKSAAIALRHSDNAKEKLLRIEQRIEATQKVEVKLDVGAAIKKTLDTLLLDGALDAILENDAAEDDADEATEIDNDEEGVTNE